MATNTYVALDKVTVGTATPSVTFSSISGSYTDLFVQMNIQGVAGSGSGANTVFVTFNGDTTSGLYSRTILLADSGGAQSSRTTGQNKINLGNAFESASASNTFGTHLLNIQNYSNATTFKTVLNRYSSNADRVGAVVGLWRNTNAITSLTITVDSSTGNIAAGSTFSLYGIAASGVSPAAKATGGAIYSDDTYYYHVFGSTGTFTPLASLTADVLTVAGGGGGSRGGGGAGGVAYYASQSLTATGYTCTVGGGGAGSTDSEGSNAAKGTSGGNSSFTGLTAAVGGGGAGADYSTVNNGLNGGSGGGSGYGRPSSDTRATGTAGQGSDGGLALSDSTTYTSGGGGGGAGAQGGDVNSGSKTGGIGGVGITTYSSWGTATGIGENVSGTYYLAGGGGGGGNTYAGGAGGYGGGAAGKNTGSSNNGLANTGGGGGGNADGVTCGQGGSGVVIVRYLKA
jgi:hypothetical protein